MTTPTREDLLGYVLGALEAQEHQQVADCLKTQPELQLELRRIKALVAPLEWSQRPPADFPVGLARRTCEIVARESRQPFGPQCAAAPTRLTRRISQPQSAVPRDASSKPRRARESAALVCCAAVLGAALGPLALQFTQALSRAPVADRAFAANRPAAQSSKTAIARLYNRGTTT